MSLTVALHNPTEARVVTFVSGGKDCAMVSFSDERGGNIEIYTAPHIALAVAEAFSAALLGPGDEPEEEAEDDDPSDVWMRPEDFALEGADLALMRRYEDGA